MDLLVQTLLITLVAAFGFAHDGVGSTMWNRPIVMAPLVGLVLGGYQNWNHDRSYLGAYLVGSIPGRSKLSSGNGIRCYYWDKLRY